jgi:hypothetical protein
LTVTLEPNRAELLAELAARLSLGSGEKMKKKLRYRARKKTRDALRARKKEKKDATRSLRPKAQRL